MVERKNSIVLLKDDLKNRLITPWKTVTFYKHLLGGLVVFGGVGVTFTIFKSPWSMAETSTALLCYFPAIAGTAMLDFEAEDQPYLRSFGFVGLMPFILIFCLGFYSKGCAQFFWSVLGALLSILFWWMANGLNDRFNDVVFKPKNAIGGDPSAALDKSPDTGWLQ
jgi:hypothetical protein